MATIMSQSGFYYILQWLIYIMATIMSQSGWPVQQILSFLSKNSLSRKTIKTIVLDTQGVCCFHFLRDIWGPNPLFSNISLRKNFTKNILTG